MHQKSLFQKSVHRTDTFNLGWWGYTFPLGVFAVTTLRLSTILPFPALAAIGTGLVVILALIWCIVVIRTVRGAWRGDLFVAPCLTQECTIQCSGGKGLAKPASTAIPIS